MKFFLSEGIVKEEEIKDFIKEKGTQNSIQNMPYILDTINKEMQLQKYKEDTRRLRYRNSALLNKIDDLEKKNKKAINGYEKKLEINKLVELAAIIILKYIGCVFNYNESFDYEIKIIENDLHRLNLLNILYYI